MKKLLMLLSMTAAFATFADFTVVLWGDNGFTMCGKFTPDWGLLRTTGTVKGTINENGLCDNGRYEAILGLSSTTLRITFPSGTCPSSELSFTIKNTDAKKFYEGSQVQITYIAKDIDNQQMKGVVEITDRT